MTAFPIAISLYQVEILIYHLGLRYPHFFLYIRGIRGFPYNRIDPDRFTETYRIKKADRRLILTAFPIAISLYQVEILIYHLGLRYLHFLLYIRGIRGFPFIRIDPEAPVAERLRALFLNHSIISQ